MLFYRFILSIAHHKIKVNYKIDSCTIHFKILKLIYTYIVILHNDIEYIVLC